MTTSASPAIRPSALVFDIQGTAVDFFAPLLRMGAEINSAKGLDLDWAALANRWRAFYRERMDLVLAGQTDWIRVDRIYREGLDRLLGEQGLDRHFSAEERDRVNTVWSRLDAWPDSVEGLARLRKRFTVAALSNAGMAATVQVAKHAALPLDAILTAELARSYKPAPAVYQLAVDYLGFPARDIMMVACHKYDLAAAGAFGMRTAFVARPFEFGPHGCSDIASNPEFDVNARDFLDLADQLGA